MGYVFKAFYQSKVRRRYKLFLLMVRMVFNIFRVYCRSGIPILSFIYNRVNETVIICVDILHFLGKERQ